MICLAASAGVIRLPGCSTLFKMSYGFWFEGEKLASLTDSRLTGSSAMIKRNGIVHTLFDLTLHAIHKMENVDLIVEMLVKMRKFSARVVDHRPRTTRIDIDSRPDPTVERMIK